MPWPSDWERRRSGIDCPVCAQGRPDRTRSGSVRFALRPRSDAYLCKRAAQRGYAQVIWRGTHAADLTDLSPEESTEFMIDVHRVALALRDHFGGTLVNVQVLCNTEPHLHAHVSVRYLDGDVAPTVPLPMGDLIEIPDNELQSDAEALEALLEPS